ncbi:MAG: flagellar biosynthesis protein [Clostridiaceae bacterium]|nr:flagellar biosynthesis protein [Clostridiaceae bacterium]
MTNRIDRRHILPYEPIDNKQKQNTAKPEKTGTSFKEILNNSLQEKTAIKISNHAQQRLQQRNIQLDDKDMDILKGAMERAEMKGARESVLFYKDIALVTSIKNRTIITAVDSKGAEENIFTNIDSAMIVESK